jgi:alcohol dehydrogenase class IV
MRKTGVPNGLSGVGFAPADVPALAQSTSRQVRAIANSPRATNLVDIENIYAAAMQY